MLTANGAVYREVQPPIVALRDHVMEHISIRKEQGEPFELLWVEEFHKDRLVP